MKPLDARILDIYDSLTPMERRLADVVLEHQRELASYSATELAVQADVSKATAARLFKRLGYASYKDARHQSRTLRRWGSPLSLLEDLEDLASSQPSVVAHLQNDIANLTRTLGALRPETIGQVIDMLVSAERIWVIGFRASHELAELAAFWLKHLQYNVSLLPSDWMAFAEDMIDMQPGDALLAIGFRRRPRMFRALLQNARDVGANVILVTERARGSEARACHAALPQPPFGRFRLLRLRDQPLELSARSACPARGHGGAHAPSTYRRPARQARRLHGPPSGPADVRSASMLPVRGWHETCEYVFAY